MLWSQLYYVYVAVLFLVSYICYSAARGPLVCRIFAAPSSYYVLRQLRIYWICLCRLVDACVKFVYLFRFLDSYPVSCLWCLSYRSVRMFLCMTGSFTLPWCIYDYSLKPVFCKTVMMFSCSIAAAFRLVVSVIWEQCFHDIFSVHTCVYWSSWTLIYAGVFFYLGTRPHILFNGWFFLVCYWLLLTWTLIYSNLQSPLLAVTCSVDSTT